MSMTPEELYWIGFGIALIILEFVLPGLVSVFLGGAAILVGLMIHFNWIHGWVQMLGAWFALSTFLVLTIRQLAARFLLSDSQYKYIEEDADAVGKIVDVIDTIHSADSRGRIRFQGTDWPARTLEGTIRKGSRAVIKYRDNISWVVEPCDEKLPKGNLKKET
jgi:membrane protein implicated in regulation of membrane protease activity